MKKIKIGLDIVMVILMILLMKTNIIGVNIHEIIGLLIFALFMIHKILNIKFIKAIGKNIFNKKIKLSSKILFWLDVFLLIFMVINVFSGILISRFIFNFTNIDNIEKITIIHKCFAWWTLILIALHIGFHIDRLVNYLTRKFKILKSKFVKIIILILYLIVAILGVISLNKYSIYSKIIPFNKLNETTLDSKEEVKKQDVNEDVKENTQDDEVPTLEEYLSQFHCDGCRKQCSLQNPRCETGKKKREEKIKEYYEKYGNNQNNDEELEKNENNSIDESNPIKEPNKNCKNKSTILDVIYIVVLFVGLSYYLNVNLINKKK